MKNFFRDCFFFERKFCVSHLKVFLIELFGSRNEVGNRENKIWINQFHKTNSTKLLALFYIVMFAVYVHASPIKNFREKVHAHKQMAIDKAIQGSKSGYFRKQKKLTLLRLFK